MKFFLLCIVFLLVSTISNAQSGTCTGSLGDPVVNISFGSGGNPGPTLPAAVPGATTTYTYTSVSGNPASPAPNDGFYTITNNVPTNPAWFSGGADHTPNDNDGYMAFFNASSNPGEFYKQTITGLCSGTKYEFAAWVANVLNPAQRIGQKPDITFVIEKPDGTVIASAASGGIDQNPVLTWKQYGFFFTLPAGVSSVNLKLINTNPGGSNFIGNDFAIDDITFRACGPDISASFSATTDQATKTQCGFGNVNLYGKVTNSSYISPGYLWQVSLNNGSSWSDLPASNQSNYVYTPTKPGSYLFRMLTAEAGNINASSCRTASKTISLTVNELPQASFKGNAICAGDLGKLDLTFSSGTGIYNVSYTDGRTTFYQSLSSSGTINLVPNPSVTTTYTLLLIQDASGCIRTTDFTTPSATVTVSPKPAAAVSPPLTTCQGDSVQLSASGGLYYEWSPVTGLNNASLPNPKAGPLTSTTYTVTVSNNSCKSTATVSVTVNPKPQINLIPTARICSGDSVQLIASGGNTYSWTPATGLNSTATDKPKASPATTTTYNVVVANAANCIDSAKTVVTVLAKPTIRISADTTICKGDSVQLISSGGNLYQWSPAAGLSSTSVSNPKASPAATSLYKLRVTNANLCTDSSAVTVTIIPKPALNIGADTLICRPFNLFVDASIADGSNYLWSNGSSLPQQTFTTGGTYYVDVKTPYCLVSDTIRINAINQPTVSLGNDITICNFQTLVLIAKGTDVRDYSWNTGSRSASTAANREGIYIVNASNTCGDASDSAYVKINLCSDDLFFPSAFTPNGDGLNDKFKAAYFKGVSIVDYLLTIYNRWGEVVFSTRNIAEGWNGLINGNRQPTNTFIWQVQYKKNSSSPLIKKAGTFTLIN